MVADAGDIETPALIVDLDAMEANAASMARLVSEHDIQLRPNVKGHKVPALAWRQLRLGAAGITCQKLSEAQVMVDAGLPDVLVAVQVIGAAKVERLLRLARQAKLTTVVDSVPGAQAISDAFCADGMVIDALLEIDIGYRRCGVPAGCAVDLALKIRDGMPGLRLVGVMGYEGHIYQLSGRQEVLDAARASCELLARAAAQLADAGIEVERVSVGASAGVVAAVATPGITEVRAGSYLLNDRAQVKLGAAGPADCAATVVATVISVPAAGRAVIDAGAKALTAETLAGVPGYGLIRGHEDAVIDRLSDEHGMVTWTGSAAPFRIGDRVHIIPNSHTVVFNQFAEVYGVRGDRVESVWPVAARGRMQ